MDPISIFISSYMDIVSNNVTAQMTDIQGIELQAVAVEHNNVVIPYSYQLWRIKPESVCNNLKLKTIAYSKCTIEAKSLFNETCAYLQSNPEQHWKYRKLKNMYCNAAISFEPKIASIEWSDKPSPLQASRSKCNLSILEFMEKSSQANLHSRNESCNAYKALKGK